jgi:acetoacetyl-CoA synthetase
MMYNWLITSLFVGSPIVLYDGSPSPALWQLIDEVGITIFGTSAKWLAVQEDLLHKNANEEAKQEQRRLLNKSHTKLRMVLSTGSPLKPQSFDFVYNFVKKDVILGSISGKASYILRVSFGQGLSTSY